MKMRLVNGVVTDLSEDPDNHFTKEIAQQFIDVPNNAPENLAFGWKYDIDTNTFTAPPELGPAPEPPEPTEPAPPQFNKKPTPSQFFLLFTAFERVALREAAKSNPIIADWLEILKDERLTYVDLTLESTQQGVMYLITVDTPDAVKDYVTTAKILTAERAATILKGSNFE